MTTGPATNLAPDAVSDVATQQAAVRAEIADAAGFLAPTWPLADFIAVNPLSGLLDRPFADAATTAADLLGARVTPDETWLRAAWQRGRITDDDLRAALARRHPTALQRGPLTLGNRAYDPVDLLVADLHQGIACPPPRRQARTAAEALAPEVAALLNTHTIQWCAAYLDEGQSTWRMPGRDRGFYSAWRALAAHDGTLPRPVRARLRHLPERAEHTILDALAALGVPDDQRTRYLQAHLACLPGFAAHVRWRGERPDSGIDLVDYLALRLAVEAAALAGSHAPGTAWSWASASRFDTRQATVDPHDRAYHLLGALEVTDTDAAQRSELVELLDQLPIQQRALVWLDAYEDHYRSRLLLRILGRPQPELPEAPPRAQVVCCIDPRSEGLRRHLEVLGSYQTLGFAGFFAVAMRYRDLAGGAARTQCPGPITPRHTLTEHPAPGRRRAAERSLAGRRVLAAAEHSLHAAKDDLLAPFALAEAAGWLAGPLAAAKTFTPRAAGATGAWWARRITPEPQTEISIAEALTPEERAATAETILTLMGLTRGFARLVVFCGHRAHTDNNPYQAALDCGACGGHPGGPNARTAAALLNDPQVRRHLADRGITVPDDTWFVPAEHDTTTDTVRLLDTHLLPATHRRDADRLTADLRTAGTRLAAERCAILPGAPTRPRPRHAARHTRARARDWAQVFPEWGLADNAAFLIAPRALTRGIDLHSRVFLHDYDPDLDPTGTVLETILTAPLVVAHWINSQYYFATVDPQSFGAGSKTLHNVTGGGLGVMTGHTSDLQPGLPWQSLTDGHHARHEPQRLLAIVQAPLPRLDTLIARHTMLHHMFSHDWIGLAAREQPDDPWHRYTPTGWQPWHPSTDTPAPTSRQALP
ncbi:DUF2309 domain-containing protein [Pseudonocardia sp. C8]|uniref:Probable inorganic carbon transporter subunit DabA n=1 Tax=Pseudonocardia parietis TaxID=570936 RepID=A0ABS4W514_9PSEU|nr:MULTISPECIES: DUF2309 domain-containing protein [Pseudonocardia]MBC3193948.1 DUF2309 domain-containing protein [Pseudonocardia sp. C8]MBP2371317.1 uncharacterized protein YbcC (UPF0753/DUF2309 family) [Pseudonocardia parietis]OJG04942.1 hypothetical protein BG618_04000 [Pseudonocardia autotrophica]